MKPNSPKFVYFKLIDAIWQGVVSPLQAYIPTDSPIWDSRFYFDTSAIAENVVKKYEGKFGKGWTVDPGDLEREAKSHRYNYTGDLEVRKGSDGLLLVLAQVEDLESGDEYPVFWGVVKPMDRQNPKEYVGVDGPILGMIWESWEEMVDCLSSLTRYLQDNKAGYREY